VAVSLQPLSVLVTPNNSADKNFVKRWFDHQVRQKCDLRTVLSSGGFGKPPLPRRAKRSNGPKQAKERVVEVVA
jgi:hypothetical protein